MRRRLPPPRAASTAVAALALLALTGCAAAQGTTASTTADTGIADAGAASRQAVLARLGEHAGPATATTPDLVGRSAAQARDVLAELGLDIHLVAVDPQQPISVQWPVAGQPVPLDGVIEAWQGSPITPAEPAPPAELSGPPPVESEVAAAAPPASPEDADPATRQTAADDAPGTAPTPESPAVAARYVLPPHTAGLLRTNPRRLPALPLGTELTGTASWYGPGFHGLRTACGGIYDQDGATIAARELRCGTVVRITGPTGLTVEATVTDWGPAEWTGRRFDLSAAVFNAIAPLGAGVVPVRVVTANVPG